MLRGWIVVVLALATSACASWTPVQRSGSWTLFVKDGETLDIDRFGRSLEPAFEVVERKMGAFENRVRVHAWEEDDATLAPRRESGPAPTPKGAAPPEGPSTGELQFVPGIGPARVRAYHVKGGPLFFQTSGVFLGTSDVGTVVHELVHARIAELGRRLPLWFEEGLASLYGDGAMLDGNWTIDGLACWPLRELREQVLTDSELARLMRLAASDEYDSRENLLVHFVGWAIVFDLARECPGADWSHWLARFEAQAAEHGLLAATRARLQSTLRASTERDWLARLSADDPSVRMAAVKGLWKLRSAEVIDRMLDALERETVPEVRAALALNILLASGETRLGRTRWNRVSGSMFPVLRDVKVPDQRENEALRTVYQSMRRWESRGSRSTQAALNELARYWEE